MFVQRKVEFKGASGTIYPFEVYPKSVQLPEIGGVYVVTYTHPRGHLSGFQVDILSMGGADNLHAVIDAFRQQDSFSEECWNYTCVMCLEQAALRNECLADLHAIKSIHY